MRELDPSCGGLLPLAGPQDGAAVSDDAGAALTRDGLRAAALALAGDWATGDKRLVFLFAANTVGSVVGLLGALAAGHAVALLDPGLAEDRVAALVAAYRPDFALAEAPVAGLGGTWAPGPLRLGGGAPIRGPVAVLLSTSGTTGSAKFVRLGAPALATNAAQIAAALEIGPESVGIGHLSMHYSYGLSVVTSHLVAGAGVFMMQDALTQPSFWTKIAAAGGTHFPGVPFHYTVLARFGLKLVPECVRCFTQAGGRLESRFLDKVAAEVAARGGRFHVMYGQTEAGPRMTTLPHDRLAAKPGSVGPALPGGRLEIVGTPPGPVRYHGPNVMLGYAESRADLDRGDDQGGVLDTGDLGWLDDEGYLHLTGRSQRFAKIAGLRLSLDEIERQLQAPCPAAVLDTGETLTVVFETGHDAAIKDRTRALAADYKIPAASFKLRPLPQLPLKSSGKIDYGKLREMMDV